MPRCKNTRTRIYYRSRRLTLASTVGQVTRYNPGVAGEWRVEGQNSARLAIRNTLPDHLTGRPCYWPSDLLPFCYIKCFVRHTYKPSPFAVILLSCWLIPACASAIGLLAASCYFTTSNAICYPRAVCHAHSAIGHCHWVPRGHVVHRMLIYLPSNANILLLTAGRSSHASSLSAFCPFFPLFVTLNAIIRPACHTLARPKGAVSGSSTR